MNTAARRAEPLRGELLAQLLHLTDKAARLNFLSQHKDLVKPEVVSWLNDSVREQARIDAQRAKQLARVGVAIAHELGNLTTLAQSLRAMGNALHVTGQNRFAFRYHEMARKHFIDLSDDDELGRTLNASIQPLILIGEYDKAFSAADQARAIFVAKGDQWRLARVELNAGNIFHRQDRFTEALGYYQTARHYFESNPQQDPEGLAAALHNVAMCLIDLNEFSRAQETYEEARRVALRHGMLGIVAQADYNIASLHYLRGEHSRAIEMLRSIRETCRQTNDRYHAALCQLDLSEIYLEVNQAAQAEKMAKEAAIGFEELAMNYERGKAIANQALSLWQQEKGGAALVVFTDARKIFESERNRLWPSRIDLCLAVILADEGRYAEARRLCLAALKIFRRSQVPHQRIACRLLLASLSLSMGRTKLARHHCDYALNDLRVFHLPSLSCQAHYQMGQIHKTFGNFDSAYAEFQVAKAALEQLRSNLHREELKISLMKDKSEIYEALVELCLTNSLGSPRWEEAFENIEESKSRTLRDLMCRKRSEFELISVADSAANSRMKQLRANINYHSRIYEAEQFGNSKLTPQRAATLQAKIRHSENKLLEIVREMPFSIAESAGLISPRAVTLDELRSHITPETTFVEYFQLRGQFLAALIRQESIEVIPLATISEVTDLSMRLAFQLSKCQLSAQYLSAFGNSMLTSTQRHLMKLYDALVRPLEPCLVGRQLIIVPHGILHSLPFHALFDGKQYLVDSFDISYAPSATIFSLCHGRANHEANSALILGIPDAAAPFVDEEVKGVAAAISGSQLFIGKSATLKALRTQSQGKRFIHIATHGYFRQEDPLFSGIRLGDGLLALYDLYQLSLPVELITLSGCVTGLSTVAHGDELLGLVRGLIYAGAKSMLLSLWEVQDRSTARLMADLYRRFAGGAQKAMALRQSMLALRDVYPHPYYWAPFVLVGG